MQKFFTLVILAALSLAPGAALAQTVGMAGAGPHGYDFMVGTWSCSNSKPSAMGGPSLSRFTVSPSASGTLFVRSTGTGYDTAGYVAYNARTQTWWGPTVFANGSYSNESTQQTGRKSVWSGSIFDAATGNTVPIRDTYTFSNLTTLKDLTQTQIRGVWKTQANSVCTKLSR
jgi:hypothetical protein